MKSFFSDRQWAWIAERRQEGYSIKDLADFLGIHRNNVLRGLIRHGYLPEQRSALPPLAERKGEFVGLNR